MGNPLSPILAVIIMYHVLDKFIKKVSFTPKIITKYTNNFFFNIKNRKDRTLLNRCKFNSRKN